MANEERALAWLLMQQKTTIPSMNQLTWIEQILPGWFDFCCAIQHGDKKIFGWGASSSEDIALCKAFSEGMERLVFLNSRSKTTSGFASHVLLDKARINAALELNERDIFLCHFLTRTPFLLIEIPENSFFKKVNDFCLNLNYRVRFFRLGSSGCLCLLDRLNNTVPEGFILGASYAIDFDDSMRSASIEACRRVFIRHALNSNIDSISLDDFKANPKPGFSEHGRLALDINYAQQISFLFPEKIEVASENCRLELDWRKFVVQDLSWPHESFTNCPFYFAQSGDEVAQQMFLGTPSLNVINLTRLSQFTNRKIEFQDINLLPHPFD